MSGTEKIKFAMIKRNMKTPQLAESLNTSTANLYQKFKRDNFSERELEEIGDILNCDLIIEFRLRDTGERI